MNLIKRISLAGILLMLTLLMSAHENAYGQTATQKAKVVTASEALTPVDKASSNTKMAIDYYDDGTYTIRGERTFGADEIINVTLEQVIDLKNKTFQIKEVHNVPSLFPMIDDAINTPSSRVVREARARLIVNGKDIAGVPLTALEVLVGLQEWDDGFREAGHNHQCYAGNPTFLGTHWFVTSCSKATSIDPNRTWASTTGVGRFHNFDFGNVNQKTELTLTGYIKGNFGPPFSFTTNWSFTPTGEGYSLIRADTQYIRDY